MGGGPTGSSAEPINNTQGERDRADDRFSVLLCVCDKDDSGYFRDALESVLNQTRTPDEVVVVVDGPVRPSLDQVIGEYETRSGFRVIRIPMNTGHGNARRVGMESCTHDLIALMDADDLSVPDRFEKQLGCFGQIENLSVVGGSIREFVHDVSNVVGVRRVPLDDLAIRDYMRRRCPFNQVTVMLRRPDVLKAGGYLDWYCDEDYYLWLRMAQCGAVFHNLSDCLVHVRVDEQMYRRRGGWRYFVSEARLQTYMLRNRIIGPFTFAGNVMVRFVVQVMMPNRIRSWFYRVLARSSE